MRDDAVEDGAAEDEAADGGTMEAMPAALLSPIAKLLTGPRADCAETKLTDEEGATGPL